MALAIHLAKMKTQQDKGNALQRNILQRLHYFIEFQKEVHGKVDVKVSFFKMAKLNLQ